MGLNYRRSIKLGKHTRLNLSKSGLGISTGVKGARVSIGPHGVRKTVGIPGTGIYYTKQSGYGKRTQQEYSGQLTQPNHPAASEPGKILVGNKNYTPKALKRISSILIVLGILLALMSLLIMVFALPFGIILLVLSAIEIRFGFAYRKMVKNYNNSEPEITAEQSSGQLSAPNSKETVAEFIQRENTEVTEKYDFFTFKVAGVTFKNGRKTRQAILRKIKFDDAPFEPPISLSIKPYDYEGETAYGVYANDEQIGNVPKEQIQYIKDNWERRDAVTAINVYGGGTTDEGEQRNYGAEVTIRFNKQMKN